MKFELTFREQYSTFPTQGLNPLLLPLWADSSPAEPQGKPKSTIVGSLSLPQQSFQPRTWTGVCCIAGVLYRIIREASYIESEVAQSCRLFVTPWTVAHQAPPSVEFSGQEYWSGLPFPSPGDLPDPGMYIYLWVGHDLASRHINTNHKCVVLMVKNLPASCGKARDTRGMSLISGLGRSPGGENGNALQYSCLEKPKTEQPGGLHTVYEASKSQTWLNNWARMQAHAHTHTHTHTQI